MEKGKNVKRYTITAALPYANGPKHIGHLAGAYLPADVYARYLRLNGKDVVFICGSDEHGTAIPNQALRENTTPQAIIDKYHALMRDCLYKLGISFDIYHRTSDPLHHETAQEFFTTLREKKVLNQKTVEHYYDEKAKTFLADRYIRGLCPRCGDPNAYGDQCENCGIALSPDELLFPRSTLTGEEPTLKSTKHWFLPLDQYTSWLRDWINERERDFHWRANVVGQCKSWVETGLKPRAITRDLNWGVPVPGSKSKVLYVWFEAPIGYISATRALFKELASNERKYATPQRDFGSVKEEDWRAYWQDEETQLVHFIGKDNIVFHCIIFPVMLKAHGDYITASHVPANEFMNLEGDKMSTSKGWSIEMDEYLETFPGKEDALRYTLLARLPEAKDSEFTWKSFKSKNNNELASILGNFINRTLVLIQNYFEGETPACGVLEPVDQDMVALLKEVPKNIGNSIEAFRFKEAALNMMDLARAGNKYLTDTEPWKVIKENPERASTTLFIAVQIAANLAILCEPFLPFSAKKIQEMLNTGPLPWAKAGSTKLIKTGHVLRKPTLMYELLDDQIVVQQMERLGKKRHERLATMLQNPPLSL